jgi:hypothetical protein
MVKGLHHRRRGSGAGCSMVKRFIIGNCAESFDREIVQR